MMWPGLVGIAGLIIGVIYHVVDNKKKVTVVDPWKNINSMSPAEYKSYVHDHIQNKRMLGDFVLTRAAFPIEANKITPEEGYSMSDETVNDKTVYSFVAAVSAEKIWGLLLDFLERMGDSCILDIESFEDKDTITLYRSAEMGTCFAVDVLVPFRDMIVNNCLLKMRVSSTTLNLSMTLTNTKHLLFQSDDWERVTALFELYHIVGKQNLRLYTEKEFVYVYEWSETNAIDELLQHFEIVETSNIPREHYVE